MVSWALILLNSFWSVENSTSNVLMHLQIQTHQDWILCLRRSAVQEEIIMSTYLESTQWSDQIIRTWPLVIPMNRNPLTWSQIQSSWSAQHPSRTDGLQTLWSHRHMNMRRCYGTDLVWHGFGPSTNMDEEDGGHGESGFQSQRVPCRNVPGSVNTGVLKQRHQWIKLLSMQTALSASCWTWLVEVCPWQTTDDRRMVHLFFTWTLRRRLNCCAVG